MPLDGYYWNQALPETKYGLDFGDAQNNDGDGQYLTVNGSSVFSASCTNVMNRKDIITSKNRYITMTGYTSSYGYTRRYINALWVR